MNSNEGKLLSQVSFSILLALSLKPRHGYELMQQINTDSMGLLAVGPGTLYGAIKQLLVDNLIEEVPSLEHKRRKNYRLTKKGWDRLSSDLSFYTSVSKLAKERHLY